MTYQQVFISCLRCIMQCQVWEHKLLLGNTLNFQCENKLKTAEWNSVFDHDRGTMTWKPGLRVQSIVQPRARDIVTAVIRGLSPSKPTEGAREGHSNGQEIAHQQKTAKISGFELTRRWRIMWIIAILCYPKFVMSIFSHNWSMEVT